VATHIAVHAGNNQSAGLGAPVATPPSVKVTDADANPVSGVSVTFAVASGGGSITGADQSTNASGIATVGSWTLGPSAGSNTLIANAAGLGSSYVAFTAIAEGISIMSVRPSGGPLAGGTSVTITGTNLGNVTRATIGGLELGSLAVVSPTQITGATPASTSLGAKDVVVTSGSHGTGTCSGCFTYVSTMLATLEAAGAHTCGLNPSGAAYCWGWNRYGQLGDGTGGTPAATDRLVPLPVATALTFSALTGGGAHTCGVTISGNAYCWGANNFGQLGDGADLGGDPFLLESVFPVPVIGGLTFTLLTAGGSANSARLAHTCGLTTSGEAYCWGYNEVGQLGDGSINSSSVPVAVKGGLRFTLLSAGDFHTCGLTSDGTAHCWGWGDVGQLGNRSMSNSSIPVAVSGGLTFTALSTGGNHACGLTAGGAVYCWGWNEVGQLGDASTTRSAVPVPVTGGLTASAIAAGNAHTCASSMAGAAYCWGHNGYGQLGNGSNNNSSVPVIVGAGLAFYDLTAGGWHNCGSTTTGAMYCWGANEVGQLGNGTTDMSTVPVDVNPPLGAVVSAAAKRGWGTPHPTWRGSRQPLPSR
jgi:alpha-tubulin suppressor-like RCC1 family protein